MIDRKNEGDERESEGKRGTKNGGEKLSEKNKGTT